MIQLLIILSNMRTNDERQGTLMYIFISHSSKNADIAQELCNVMESNGSQCFIAPRNIRSGYEYAAEILDGIDRSDAMLLVLSKEINNSPHVLREIERAVSKSIPIIVYKLEEVTLSKSMEYFLMTHQWLNAEKGNHEHLLKCIEDLKNNTSTAIFAAAPLDVKKRKSKKLPLVIGVAATGAIALIASLFIILSSSDKENDTTNTTEKGSQVVNNTTTDDNKTDSKEDSTKENTTENNNASNYDIKLGDTVVFGNYNDADIYWKVIKISEDGTEAVLISRNLLSFKAFSAAESGNCHSDGKTNYIGSDSEVLATDFELQSYVWGNSSWSSSTIRAWLNSDRDYVEYEGQRPIANAMSDNKNGYNSEPGFLYNFSDEELAAIKETTIETKGNALSDEDIITTTDRVFLLSIDELQWLKDAKVPLYVTPTSEAIDKNESPWYREYCLEYYHTDTCLWWLRDPVDGKSSECYAVSYGENTPDLYYPYIVSVEDFGIRPAITVDLTSDCIKVEK